MTDSHDALGLGGILPGPGWVVLDAARTHRFTGELVMRGDIEVRVYLDRGRIYVAERADDPPLGDRLVEAGALHRAQLDYGTMRIGDIEHLGRLFDRVPSINRDGVLVINQLMTDEVIRAVAGQRVSTVTVTPYRHHPSGMHRWEVVRDIEAVLESEVPEMALPAPAPDATPVSDAPPAELERLLAERDERDEQTEGGAPVVPCVGDTSPDDRDRRGRDEPGAIDALFDDLVRWDEPSRIDPTFGAGRPATGRTGRASDRIAEAQPASRATVTTTVPPGDWIDRLDQHGVADAPVGAPVGRLSPLPVKPQEHFEIVWPSGETIDVVPDEAGVDHTEGDVDRAGPTARLGEIDEPEPVAPPEAPQDTTNELAIRRAVATIDTGSLEARRRLVHAATPTFDAAPELPGRHAMRNEHTARSMTVPRSTSSVFDEVPAEIPEPEPEPEPPSDDRHGRAGALRRLIGNLRGH